MNIDIDVILADLKDGKSPRTQSNLDSLNDILKAHAESGKRDFCITTIGRVSAEKGGPGYEAVRATRNLHFRTLIEQWASKSSATTTKPLSPTARSKSIPQDYKLLERISDVAVRALFGQIIAERNKYLKEVNLLKQQANITIDKRPVRQFDAEPIVELLPSLTGVLNKSEKEALAYAISDECMKTHNWETTLAGQVKDMEYNTEIFPRGFATGLRKVLGEVDN